MRIRIEIIGELDNDPDAETAGAAVVQGLEALMPYVLDNVTVAWAPMETEQ